MPESNLLGIGGAIGVILAILLALALLLAPLFIANALYRQADALNRIATALGAPSQQTLGRQSKFKAADLAALGALIFVGIAAVWFIAASLSNL